MTDVLLDKSSNSLSFKNTGPLSLGKVTVKPLMQPPQMRHFNNYSNPDYPPNLNARIPAQLSEQSAQNPLPLSETAKMPNNVTSRTTSPDHQFIQSPRLPYNTYELVC